jgi:hypothetical protein
MQVYDQHIAEQEKIAWDADFEAAIERIDRVRVVLTLLDFSNEESTFLLEFMYGRNHTVDQRLSLWQYAMSITKGKPIGRSTLADRLSGSPENPSAYISALVRTAKARLREYELDPWLFEDARDTDLAAAEEESYRLPSRGGVMTGKPGKAAREWLRKIGTPLETARRYIETLHLAVYLSRLSLV